MRRPLTSLLAALAVALLVPAAATAVVGGTSAAVADAPWLGQMEVGGGRDRVVACGATLIGPQVALTAAHCLLAFPRARRIRVVFGRQQRGAGPFAEARRVARVSIQPIYLKLQQDNRGDVALLFFDEPVATAPIELATPASPIVPGTPALTLGWGLSATGRPARSLVQATLPLRSAGSCRRAFRGIGVLPNRRYELCAGATRTNRPMACSGDSGGPLITTGADGVARQVGIVSWGDGRDLCRRGSRPGMFARVDAGPHRRWLDGALARGRGDLRLPLARAVKLPPGGFGLDTTTRGPAPSRDRAP